MDGIYHELSHAVIAAIPGDFENVHVRGARIEVADGEGRASEMMT